MKILTLGVITNMSYSTIISCTVIICLALYFSQLSLDEVIASSYSPGKFKVYENSDYRIRMLYPQDWKVSETGLSSYGIVKFSAPEIEDKISSVRTIIFVPADVYVFEEPLKNSSWTNADYFNDFMKNTYSSNGQYKLINTSSTTLAGVPAHVSLLYDYKNNVTSKVMRIIAISNNTIHRISYYSDPGTFNDYLPVVNEMIQSFERNFQPIPAQLSQNISKQEVNSAEIQSNKSSQNLIPNHVSGMNSQTIDPSKLPQFLTVQVRIRSTDFPLTAVIGPNSSLQTGTVTDIPSSTFEFRDWNPKFTFQFIKGSNAGLQVVKSVLIGQIKSYDSIEDALSNAKLWKDIPLNEQTVLRLDHLGLNFIIIEVDFRNSLYGLYSGTFDVQKSLDKRLSGMLLSDDLKEDRSLTVASTSKHNTMKAPYWDAVKPVVCDDLSAFGFRVCK